MNEPEEVIFAGQYSYRKKGILFVGCLLLFFSAVLITLYFRNCPAPFAASNLLLACFLVLPGWLGAILLRDYQRHFAITLILAHKGVTFGTSVIPWTRIRLVKVELSADGYLHFTIGRTGMRSDLQFPTDSIISAADAKQIVFRLGQFLAEHYPEVPVYC